MPYLPPKLDPTLKNTFSNALLNWFDSHGRKSLPWQQNRNPYWIWVSEIMLQQTQVDTVIPYYQKFITRFPDIETLANASPDDVMSMWAGLGYYARARNLHKAAQQICQRHNGEFPTDFNDVVELAGIGRSTAGAILAFSCNQRHAILDGNVKRVLSRVCGIFGYPGTKSVENTLWEIADSLTPDLRVADYTQGIMDLGATLCTRSKPKCNTCPMQTECVAQSQNLQSQLPESKPKTHRPLRHIRMILIDDGAQNYFLVKRPPSGIWGGLWSFPEISDEDVNHQDWCHNQLGLNVGPGTPLDPIRHGFTHFELNIQPILCDLTGSNDQIMDGTDFLWYNQTSDNKIGIPAAAAKIFNQL